MPRRHRITLPVDTCLFSPAQLQPATALRFGMTGLAGTIRTQLVDWPILKKEHRTTVVIAGIAIDYLRPFQFFSGAELEVDSGLVARRGGRFLELDCRLRAPGGEDFARLTTLTRPVRLSGSEALDATPADLDAALLRRFQPDERDDGPVPRPLPARLEAVTGQGTLLAEGSTAFFVSRSDCEIADQWQNVRLPDWFASAREQLVLGHGSGALTAGLSQPMARLLAEFRRPMFFGDRGALRTRAYRHGAALVFVHDVTSMLPGVAESRRPLCATGIEEFPLEPQESN
jgi:acyl-CoA thioesterase FadM